MTPEDNIKKLTEKEIAALAEKEERNRRMLDTSLITPENAAESEEEFEVQLVTDHHWKQILEHYKKKFPDAKPLKDGTLAFATHKDAQMFFADMAANGLEFLATRVENGIRQDDHFFSCGDSKIYEGTLAQIAEQLQTALKTEASPDIQAKLHSGLEHIKKIMPKEINPAVEMRSKLQKVTESNILPSDNTPGSSFK